MNVLKAGELKLEREEDAKEKAKEEREQERERGDTPGFRIMTSSPTQMSPTHMNGNGGIDPLDNETTGDEIRPAPTQERTGRDIRFGNLPHPRKHERQNSEGIVTIFRYLFKPWEIMSRRSMILRRRWGKGRLQSMNLRRQIDGIRFNRDYDGLRRPDLLEQRPLNEY
jgi:hypothetical protein